MTALLCLASTACKYCLRLVNARGTTNDGFLLRDQSWLGLLRRLRRKRAAGSGQWPNSQPTSRSAAWARKTFRLPLSFMRYGAISRSKKSSARRRRCRLARTQCQATVALAQVVGLFMAIGFWTVSRRAQSSADLSVSLSVPSYPRPKHCRRHRRCLQACYSAQPSRTVARPLTTAITNSKRAAAARQAYDAAMLQATATVQKLSWLRKVGVLPHVWRWHVVDWLHRGMVVPFKAQSLDLTGHCCLAGLGRRPCAADGLAGGEPVCSGGHQAGNVSLQALGRVQADAFDQAVGQAGRAPSCREDIAAGERRRPCAGPQAPPAWWLKSHCLRCLHSLAPRPFTAKLLDLLRLACP